MCKINPLLEETELYEKINSLMCLEEVPYVFRDAKLKEEKLRKVEKTWNDIDQSTLDYSAKAKMFPKVYAIKFILGLKEGNDYLQFLASGGIGFILGVVADEGFRSYVKKIAGEFLENMQYSKS